MTHASVFSGIGGPEVAATMLGWENLFHCEINPFGRKVLDYWYPNSKSYEDITRTDFTEWRGRVDVLTGGFPCQPFSYAGRRRGAEDDRYLWPSMYRAIDEIQPTWVVAENVAGILTMVEQGEVSKVAGSASLFDAFDDLRGRYELRETFTLQRICTDLESHGYAVQPVLVPACAVGAPHRRDRVFIVARRCDAPYPNGTRARDNDGATCDEGRTACEDWRESLRQGHGQTGASGTEPTSDDDIADTNGTRQSASDQSSGRTRQTMDGECRGESFDGTERPCTLRPIADTISEDTMHSGFIHGQHEVEGYQRNEWNISAGGSERLCGIASRFEDTEAIAGCGRWQNFPSVSPVHRGNDGLPFDVDRLTLSFGKWRTEALKAYGNAIVPQVMYEIFRAIQQVEQMSNPI